VDALARDVGRTVEVRHHLGDLVGVAVQPRVAAIGRRRGFHAQQRRGGHLPARHAVDGIVDVDRHHVLAACGGMDRLGRTDRRKVAVALVGEDHVLGMQPLDGRRDGQRTAVRRLDPVDVDIIVCENGAAHGRNADRAVGHAHLPDHLGHQLVHRAVAATRAVVHHVVGQQRRLAVDQILLLYFNFRHCLTL